MVRRKPDDLMRGPDSGSIPLAIQSFLWRQTEPFFRQKLGKLYEASCVLFEHVLVENKFHGLPPSLYTAVTRTTRQQLIQSALPHVMYCASVMLSNRGKLGHADKLGVAATKLLHTFHSTLLKSMDTTLMNDENRLPICIISDIELFVFLFAPLANSVKESDLTFRLASGIKTWEALWNHEAPDMAAMNILVKPKQRVNSNKDKNSQEGAENEGESSDDGLFAAAPFNQVTSFDVAVLRCMFFSRWSEDGLLWGVTYIMKRLHQSTENLGAVRERTKIWRRSRSVHIPSFSNEDKNIKTSVCKKVSTGVQFSGIHEKNTERTRKSRGFLNRLRISDKRRKSTKVSVSQYASIFEALKDASPDIVDEEKDFKEKRREPGVKKRTSLSGRKRFKTSSSSAEQTASGLKNDDEPSNYDIVTKHGAVLRKQVSFDGVTHNKQLQRMEHVVEENGEHSYDGENSVNKDLVSEKPCCSEVSRNKLASRRKKIGKENDPIKRRWASDSCVSYNKDPRMIDAEVTSSYVTSEGYFRSDVILRVIEVMIARDPGVKIYDACVQILECIIRNVYIKKNVPENDQQTPTVKLRRQQAHVQFKHSQKQPEKEDIIHVIRVILKIIRAMGCIKNCSKSGHRGSAGDRLRLKIRLLLVEIHQSFGEILCEHISNMLKSETLKDCVEILHYIYVSCDIEFNSTLVVGVDDDNNWIEGKDKKTQEEEMTATIAKNTFELFIQKCLIAQNDLYSAHCKVLYKEVRGIVQYIKMQHQSIFNKLLLNVMLISARKSKLWKKDKEKQEVKKPDENPEIPNVVKQSGANKRRGAITLSNSPLLGHGNNRCSRSMPKLKSRFSLLWNEGNSDTESAQSTSGPSQQSRTGSVFGKLQFSSWLKIRHDSSSSLDLDEPNSENFPNVAGEKTKSSERSFMNLIKGKTVKKQMSAPLESVLSEDIAEELYHGDTYKQDSTSSNQFKVDLKDIKSGLKILRFLMESCPPGTVPEPKILAAAIDLESPILCRAAFFLEVAVFVNRCNNFDWPIWMSNDTMTQKMYVRASRQHVRNLKLQSSAGKLFYTWGEALGRRLEDLCSMESGAVFVLPNVRSDAEKIRLREKDMRENFLYDNFVNRSGTACPVALKNMVARLLHEITSFIRDVAPHCRLMTRKYSGVQTSRSDDEENGGAVSAEPPPVSRSQSHTSNKPVSGGRRPSITFFDTVEKKNPQYLFPGHIDGKLGRKSAPDSALRSDFKNMPFHSPKCQIRRLSTTQEYIGDRRRSITSTGTALEDLKENSPLISASSVSVCTEIPSRIDEESRSRKKSVNQPSASNYLTVPGLHGAPSRSHGGFSSVGSIVSLGDVSIMGDDHSYIGSDYRGSMYLSSVSITSSHTEGIRSPSSSNADSRIEDDSLKKIPWLRIMLAIANQQNFVCEHRNFCHAYCHERLARQCRRLVEALCKALDLSLNDEMPNRKTSIRSICNKNEKYNGFVSRYLKTHCASLMSAPILVLTKSATLLSDEMFFDVHSFCWEMILNKNKDVSTAAAVLFLLCAVKTPQQVFTTITSELSHHDDNLRLDAISKFQVLWNCRHAVWERAQDGATRIFKSTRTGISYTLPKETIGTEFLSVPDAPWLASVGNIEEAILAQSSSALENSALITTDTTSHQKEKQMKRAIRKEEEARAAARKKYHLTDIPIVRFVAAEVQKSAFIIQTEDEGDSFVASRRFSHAPSIASSTHSSKDVRFSEAGRPSSRQLGRISKRDIEDYKTDDQQNSRDASSAKASAVFPPCIAACIPILVNNCKDAQLSKTHFSVGETAQHTLESCLIEDPGLFLRQMFETLSGKDKQQRQNARILQKLPLLLGRLPPHVAYTIFINVLGIIMKAVRSSIPGCDENVIACIGILASVAPYVEGLEFKALKIAFRKEQSDLELLITSGLPGPRKLTIWNHSDYYMPALVDVNEESTFENVMIDAMHQNDIPESDKYKYQLVDRRSNKIHCLHFYVRDVYSFNKKVFPELTLVEMEAEEADRRIKSRAILTQLEEINKLRFTLSVLVNKRTLEDKQLNASFILDEFLRLKCFPRKAIQAPFQLFSGRNGRQIFDIDMMQKSWWIQLISTVFHFIPSEFPWGQELMLFLHVWNAALVLHAEQVPILRRYGAAVIDAAVHMNHQFIKHGYSVVLPTILEVYSQHYRMPTVKNYIEFLCKQLHIVHRHPFVLELIASAAPLLAAYSDGSNTTKLRMQLSPTKFFTLLKSLDRESAPDDLNVLELVEAEQPLFSLDFCYKNDSFSLTITDCFRLAVTVVACQPESIRTLEMLIVFDNILPHYLNFFHKRTLETGSKANEISSIKEIVVCIRALLLNLECLTRNLNHPSSQQQTAQKVFYRDGSAAGGNSKLRQTPNAQGDNPRVMEEGQLIDISDQEKFRTVAEEFLAPRDVILNLCSKYFTHVKKRFSLFDQSAVHNIEILNDKSHTRLAEIAQSLLRLLTEESFSVKCLGLLSYLTELIPNVDWSQEHVRATLFLILKRLDRMFIKINGMSEASRQKLNWKDLRQIVEALGKLIHNQPVVSIIPHVKSIVNINLAMLIGSSALLEGEWTPRNSNLTDSSVPHQYIPAILRLTIIYMHSLRTSLTLEDLVRHFTQGKRDFVILNFFIPLSLYVAGLQASPCENHLSDITFPIRECDIMYMFNYAFEILAKDSALMSNNISQLLLFTSPVSHRRTAISHQTSLLLLKVLIVSFHEHLQRHWFKIASTIKNIVIQRSNNNETWLFMDFIMSIKTPLILYLRPFVLTQMMKVKMECLQLGVLKEQLKTKLIHLKFKEINLSQLKREYGREVATLKSDIAANAPGSKNKFEKGIKDGHHRSFRHSMLPTNFGRKASERNPTSACENSDSSNKFVCPSPKVNHENDNAITKSLEPGSRDDKHPIRRRWTQRAPSSQRTTKTGKQRHSVSTPTAKQRDNDVLEGLDSKIRTRSPPRLITIPSIKIDSSRTPKIKRAKRAILESDEFTDAVASVDQTIEEKSSLTINTTNETPECFTSEKSSNGQKNKKSLMSMPETLTLKSPKRFPVLTKATSLDSATSPTTINKQKTSIVKINKPPRILSPTVSAVQVCVTAPTPPARRRSSTDVESGSKSIETRPRGRKISTTMKPNLVSLMPAGHLKMEKEKSRGRKLSPVLELNNDAGKSKV